MNAIENKSFWQPIRISCVFHVALFVFIGLFSSLTYNEVKIAQEKTVIVELFEEVKEPTVVNSAPAMPTNEPTLPVTAVNQPLTSVQKATPVSQQSTDSLPPAASASTDGQAGGDSVPVSGGSGTADAAGTADFQGGNGVSENTSGTAAPQGVSEADKRAAADRFARSVEANKKYPYMAVRRNVQGTVVVNVVLDAAGNLSSVSVGSGVDGTIDNAAIAAVRAACPFQHGLNERLSMEVPVRFYLQ